MRRIYRIIPLLLLAILFRTQLVRFSHTARDAYYASGLGAYVARRLGVYVPPEWERWRESRENATWIGIPPHPDPIHVGPEKGLEFLVSHVQSPNGHQVSIFLAELQAAYFPLDRDDDEFYTTYTIGPCPTKEVGNSYSSIITGKDYPILIDHDNNHIAIEQSAAILSYLARHYDPDHRFSFTQEPELSQSEQWLAWSTSELSPMQAEAMHYFWQIDHEPYSELRFHSELARLYEVLNSHLQANTYMVGRNFSIADIAVFSAVNFAPAVLIDLEDFPSVRRWAQAIELRAGVQKGCAIPAVGDKGWTNQAFQNRIRHESGLRRREKELRRRLRKPS